MRRVLSLYLPMWSMDLVRRRQRQARTVSLAGAPREAGGPREMCEAPVLLTLIIAERDLVAQCCERCLAAGVQPGMTLAHARALLPVGSTRNAAGRSPSQNPRGKGTQGSACRKSYDSRMHAGRSISEASIGVSAPDHAVPIRRAASAISNPPSAIRNPQSSPPPLALPFTPHRDLAALHKLAGWATRFAPTVSVDPDFARLVEAATSITEFVQRAHQFSLYPGLLMDITGCDRLYRGEARLLHRLCDAVERLGFRCRAAIAPTFGCAWAVARFGERDRAIVHEHEAPSVLAPLPVRALRIDDDIEAALAEVAVDRVGQVLDLPRHELPARFGDDLILRIDQALGAALETIEPVRPQAPPVVERLFAGPTTQFEAIAVTVRELVAELIPPLLDRESGARQIDLDLIRVESEPVRITVTFSHPTRQARHIHALLAPQLEKANLGHGVDRVLLTASRTGRLKHTQREMLRGKDRIPLPPSGGREGLREGKAHEVSQHEKTSSASNDESSAESQALTFTGNATLPQPLPEREGSSEPDLSPAELHQHLGEMLDVMMHRLGEDRVLRAEPVGTHHPRRAFRYQPATRPLADSPASRRRKAKRKPPPHALTDDQPVVAAPAAPFDFSTAIGDRPSLLFDPPEPAQVMAVTPDGPPAWLRWRGREHRILHATGPLRIAEEWWRKGSDEVTKQRSDGVTKRRRDEGTKRRSDEVDQDASLFTASLRHCVTSSLSSDYFRVADDAGRWLWIARVWPANRWFICGQWV